MARSQANPTLHQTPDSHAVPAGTGGGAGELNVRTGRKELTHMRVFLTGVGCIGKTTIGSKLADLQGCPFFDLDEEVERFFGVPIERLQNKFLTVHSYSVEAAKALSSLIERPDSRSAVIALPPSGLMRGYWRVMKKAAGTTVALTDKPEHILERITFYDADSNLIAKRLTVKEKKLYLIEIKKDITYFRKSYERADLRVNIAGLDADGAARKIRKTLQAHEDKERSPNQQVHALRSEANPKRVN